ncbi:uncharacterized protein LOC143682714 [Tamandua tetradactyla]|uniref:uncharacterized protein LOC143682714 n=1 Tax=Tamandua tetradactyla TaxID=48850 RepID=UPI004053802F
MKVSLISASSFHGFLSVFIQFIKDCSRGLRPILNGVTHHLLCQKQSNRFKSLSSLVSKQNTGFLMNFNSSSTYHLTADIVLLIKEDKLLVLSSLSLIGLQVVNCIIIFW